MKLLSQFKTCDVITISNGLLFALKGSIGYLVIDKRFKKVNTAVDAKIFVQAMKKLDTNFFIDETEETLTLFDETQQIVFNKLAKEKIPKVPQSVHFWTDKEIVKAWNFANSFIDNEYPGIRMAGSFIEVLSSQHIFRLYLNYRYKEEGIFVNCKLPSGIEEYAILNNRLWFKGPNFYIIVSGLELDFPSTDAFFEVSLDWQLIPDKLRNNLIDAADYIQFKTDGAHFIKNERATSLIEGIIGQGKYDTRKFKRFIENSAYYYFDQHKVYFKGVNFQGVLASAV